MTPTGVEHGRPTGTPKTSELVNRSLTPTGVEHFFGGAWRAIRAEGEPIFDADRR